MDKVGSSRDASGGLMRNAAQHPDGICDATTASSPARLSYTERHEVLIDGLRVEALIGVNPGERTRPQLLILDIRLQIAPCRADDLGDTVDYCRIAAKVDILASRHVGLIETFAGQLAQWCMQFDKVVMTEVVIGKPGAITNGLAKTRVVLTRQWDDLPA